MVEVIKYDRDFLSSISFDTFLKGYNFEKYMIDNIMTKYFYSNIKEAKYMYFKRDYYKGDYIYNDDLQDYEYNDFAKQIDFYSYLLNDEVLNYQFHKLMINIEEERKTFLKSLYLDFIKYLLKYYFKLTIFDDEKYNDSYEINIYYTDVFLKYPLYNSDNYEFEKINPNNDFILIDSFEILLDYLFNITCYSCSLNISLDNCIIRNIDIIDVKLSNDSNRYRFINSSSCIKINDMLKDINIDDLILELNFNKYNNVISKAIQYKNFNITF